MKPIKHILLALLLLSVLMWTGCSTMEKVFLKEVVTQEQQEVITGTNIVEITEGVFETNAVKEVQWVPVTNYVANPYLTGTVDMVASNVGIPAGGLIGGIFATILTGIGGWVSAKRRQQGTLESIVGSVEAGREELGRAIEEAEARGTALSKDKAEAALLKGMKTAQKATGHIDKIRPIVRKIQSLRK